jgi:hypothetical protein
MELHDCSLRNAGPFGGQAGFPGPPEVYIKFFAFNNPIRNMIEVDE